MEDIEGNHDTQLRSSETSAGLFYPFLGHHPLRKIQTNEKESREEQQER